MVENPVSRTRDDVSVKISWFSHMPGRMPPVITSWIPARPSRYSASQPGLSQPLNINALRVNLVNIGIVDVDQQLGCLCAIFEKPEWMNEPTLRAVDWKQTSDHSNMATGRTAEHGLFNRIRYLAPMVPWTYTSLPSKPATIGAVYWCAQHTDHATCDICAAVGCIQHCVQRRRCGLIKTKTISYSFS